MFEHILVFINKGTAIGFLSGSFRAVMNIRRGSATTLLTLTDILGGAIAGTCMWYVLIPFDLLEHIKIGTSVMVSPNVYWIISVLTDPKVLRKVIRHYSQDGGSDDS